MRLALTGLLALAGASGAWGQGVGKPIIDMHMHAWSLSEFGGELPEACVGPDGIDMHGIDPGKPSEFRKQITCQRMVKAAHDDAALLAKTLGEMDRYNVVAGVLAGDRELVRKWRSAAPGRILPAANFFAGDDPPPRSRSRELEQRVRSGETQIFAEITPQYRGLRPDHPSLEPFYAMAERLDVPVGIHMGYGAPGGAYWIYPKYRASLGNPLLLEDLLVRHRKMRVYVMHAGVPMVDEMIMNAHPQVFVDFAGDNWGLPRKEFHFILKRMVDAGYGKRIMFGSDQMVWPETIGIAIESITQADFLSEQQKRDILYNNAARFLRLTPEQIAAHHR
jgi:predicted TIM-barrel fold metal-dependent hydrolase